MLYCTISLCANPLQHIWTTKKYITDGFLIFIGLIKVEGKRENICVIFSIMWDPLGNI